MRSTTVALLLSATMFYTPLALAQTAAQTVPAAASADQQGDPAADSATTGDIIVTAQRRNESLQRVPVSVTAVTADTLRNQQLNDLVQITRVAPSLQVGIDNSFAVRGVGTTSFAGTIDSSVALAVDDVNFGRPILGGLPFYDLAQVEVLNGPQGLLFGKNASAGLINITTARPRIGEWQNITELEFDQRATPGNDSNAFGIIARQAVNIPVSSNSALRIAGLYQQQEPATKQVGLTGLRNDPDLEQYSIRGKYLLESGPLSVYVIGEYNKSRGVAGIFDRNYTQLDPLSVNRAPLAVDGIVAGNRNFLNASEVGQWRDIDTGGVRASISYELGSGFEISNIAAWRYYTQDQNNDADATSSNGASRNFTQARYDQYSNELRLSLPAENRLSGQVGLFYFKSTLDQYNQIGGLNYLPAAFARGYPFCVGATPVPGAPPGTCSVRNDFFLGSDRDYVLDTQSYAAFGQLTFDVTDQLKLIAGGRVTRDEIDIDLTQGQGNYFQNLGGPRGRFQQSFENTNLSWKVGAQYQATSALMFYGFYGRGYKGPGFNDVAVSPTASLVVRPEISNTAEIGVKSSFLDRRVILNVSAFHSKFDDFQVQSFDSVLRTFTVQNAAEVTSKGVEASLIVTPTAGLSLSANASLLESTFDRFPNAQCFPTQATLGCSANVNTFDASGFTLPLAPKFTSTVAAQYEMPGAGPVRPFIGGNWYHRSTIAYQLNRSPGVIQAPIDVFGANLGIALANGMRFALFCKNCTNEIVPTAIGTEAGDAAARSNTGAPTPRLSYTRQVGFDSVRVVGVTAAFRF